MSLPMDPDEQVGTPEYEELRSHLQIKSQVMLELMQEEKEQLEYDRIQYPWRFSH